MKAKYESDKTPLRLGELEIPCYVLEDGTRVFSGRGIQKVLRSNATSGKWLNKFANNSVITQFITDSETGSMSVLDKVNNPIPFYRPTSGGSQSKTYGYEVTLLIDLCDAIIKANETGFPIDEVIVRSANVIIRSVAKVGIVALVDEATGYQYDREKDELQKILKSYISEELLPWQKRFPDLYYKELFRLNAWDFTVNGIKKRPSVIGKWTNTIIYEELPKGVLDELKNKTPKSEAGNRTERFHQFLTLDIGEPNLEKQINKVITLFQVSDNMKQFWDNFKKMKMRQLGQLEFLFDFDEKGHTKA